MVHIPHIFCKTGTFSKKDQLFCQKQKGGLYYPRCVKFGPLSQIWTSIHIPKLVVVYIPSHGNIIQINMLLKVLDPQVMSARSGFSRSRACEAWLESHFIYDNQQGLFSANQFISLINFLKLSRVDPTKHVFLTRFFSLAA